MDSFIVPPATELTPSTIVLVKPGAIMAAKILQTLSNEPDKSKRKKMAANRPKPTGRSSRLKGQD